jgi:hypothetical protein
MRCTVLLVGIIIINVKTPAMAINGIDSAEISKIFPIDKPTSNALYV